MDWTDMDKTNDIIEQRRQKLEDLKEKNINPFPNDFVVTDTIKIF